MHSPLVPQVSKTPGLQCQGEHRRIEYLADLINTQLGLDRASLLDMSAKHTMPLVWGPLLAGLLVGCGSEVPAQPDCADSGCDEILGMQEQACFDRRTEAFDPNRAAFLEGAIRWACSDSPDAAPSELKQEYCESFALLSLPSMQSPAVLGKNLGIDSAAGETPPGIELSAEDIGYLEDVAAKDPELAVGQCVFTSWNSDYLEEAPGCREEDEDGGYFDPDLESCPRVLGLALSSELFRTTFEANSAGAAQRLVEDCYRDAPFVETIESEELAADVFFRGCMLNADAKGTEYRKSDSFICASAVRLEECGCSLVDEDLSLSEELSPFTKMGFPLGTWSSQYELPPGCHFIFDGDENGSLINDEGTFASGTLVQCDLSAADVLRGGSNLQQHCVEKYGDNLVVHVPIPSPDQIVCDSQLDKPTPGQECSEMPWILPGQ